MAPDSTAVAHALDRVETAADDTRGSVRALVTVLSGIDADTAIPAMLGALRRLQAVAVTPEDRFVSTPLVETLLRFADRDDVSAALAAWSDVVSAVDAARQERGD